MKCAKCGKEHERVTEEKPCCFDCYHRVSVHIAWLTGVIVLKTMASHRPDDILDVLNSLSDYANENHACLDDDLAGAIAYFLSQFPDETIPATLDL